MRRCRVLISAYALSPTRGSEPGTGWNFCRRLAEHHDVTVLCAPGVPPDAQDFRGEIEQHARAFGAIPGLTLRFVEPPLASYLFQRETPLMRRTLYYVGYRAWQRAAYRAARKLHAQQSFDVVHQLNTTSFREPGFLWMLPRVPFVWGPIGGAADVPAAFLSLMSRSERAFYAWRNAANALHRRSLRRCRRAARRASRIWVIGPAERHMVEHVWGCAAEHLCEVGGEHHPARRLRSYDGTRPFRVVWSGQHVGRKALPILLHALSSIGSTVTFELTVIGEGPQSAAWQRLAAQLGIADAIRWTGPLPWADAQHEMSRADAFVLTSLVEGTSMALIEALSLGLPVICHDACGMSWAVTDACGIKVRVVDPEISARGFGDAIRRLVERPGEVARLSEGALRRSEELSWNNTVRHVAETYRALAARAPARAEATCIR